MRTSSSTTASALKTDGWPQPLRMMRAARFRKRSGFFLLNWMLDEGCSSRISSMTSRMRYVRSLTPSEPSGFRPPLLMLAKSV